MASTAFFELRGTLTGLPSGTEEIYVPAINSTGAGALTQLIVLTTGTSVATKVVAPSNARFMLVIPPSTNQTPYRMVETTGDVGIVCSSQGPLFISVTAASSYGFFSTGGTTLGDFRVGFY